MKIPSFIVVKMRSGAGGQSVAENEMVMLSREQADSYIKSMDDQDKYFVRTSTLQASREELQDILDDPTFS